MTEGKKKKVISFVDAYNKLKWKRATRILNQENTSIHKVSFEHGQIRKWIHNTNGNKRRVGRPRANWTEETIREIWDAVKKNNAEFRYQQFDENNNSMIELMKNFEVTNDHFCPPPPP